MFPTDIASLIFSYTDDDKLRDWVDEEKLDWECLSSNPNAIHILEKNLASPEGLVKVNWWYLSGNPNAIHILEKKLAETEGLDKVDWWWLSKNPNAIHILEKNLDKVDWEWLSRNPSIFTKDKRKEEELMKLRWTKIKE